MQIDSLHVFGNPNASLGAPTLVELLRKNVQTGLTNFAKTGSATPNGQRAWPRYTLASDQHMSLKAELSIASGLSKPDCDFWDYVSTLQ
jgi:carboxylesterase type B